MTDQHHTYTTLLERHREMLWYMCWKKANGNYDRCQDLLQEVSIQLWENFGKLRTNSTTWQERAWVRWQARSVFYQIDRRKTLYTEPLTEDFFHSTADEESVHRKELLDSLISTLTPDEQQMMQFYLDGYHGDEIGAAMGINRDAVYQRMHRTIQKMRRVVLILLALLLTSLVAIAVVPEWRQFFFGGKNNETPPSTPTQPPKEPVPQPIDTIPHTNQVKQAPKAKAEPLEKMPTLDILSLILSLMDVPDETIEPPSDVEPTISLDGSRLTITGVDGELVRVFDCSGNLIAAQKASVICTIDLYPSTSTFRGLASNGSAMSTRSKCDEYVVMIGDRPALKVQIQ